MPAILDEIRDAFLKRLTASGKVDQEAVEELRGLLQSDKKLKADDFIEILQAAAKRRPS
jgi:hypothetical protein